jgi:signal peptidase I
MSRRTLIILGSLGAIVVLGLVAFVVLRVFFFVPFKQPSASMYPSMPVNGFIFVDRVSSKPDYGLVLVFKYPENPAQEFDKRVVALSGDKVETRNAVLFVNGWEVPHCIVGKHTYDDADTLPPHHEGTLELEWLGDQAYLIFHDDGKFAVDTKYTVKDGEYFVMGDNRENSHDSRMWFGGAGGGVPNGNTVGRVRMGKLALPRGAESLQSALDACLAKKPATVTPPRASAR